MLSSIHPLGERVRRNRWGLTVTAYLTGNLLGGAFAGALLGLLGTAMASVVPHVSETAVAGAVAIVVVTTLAWDVAATRLSLPSIRRQVDEDWLNRYRGWVYGVGYGVQLGVGVATVVTTAAVYGWMALALLSGSPLAGLVIGSVFGGVRGLALVPARRVTDPSALRALHRQLAQ